MLKDRLYLTYSTLTRASEDTNSQFLWRNYIWVFILSISDNSGGILERKMFADHHSPKVIFFIVSDELYPFVQNIVHLVF